MADAGPQSELFATDTGAGDTIVINARCAMRCEGDLRIVVGAGSPLAHFVVGDRMARAHAMVSLVEQGWAEQTDVARAFGCSPRTLRRYQQRYDEGGLAMLGRAGGYPKGRPRWPSRDHLVGKLKAEGVSNRVIAQRLGVDEKAVRKRLRRLGWVPARPEQLSFLAGVSSDPSGAGADPNLSALPTPSVADVPPTAGAGADPNLSAPEAPPVEPEPVATTTDRNPADRAGDRLAAYLGWIDDAAPLFRNGNAVPGAGVLLALPALLDTGVLHAARRIYGSIGPAFYGLRTTIVTMLLMALLRIKRPEALKERSPSDLGRIVGLDRAPEVKTLRRKLTRLAARGGGAAWGRLLAQRRVAVHGNALGFLYVDGHVRVYHGQRRIPKTHVARLRLPAPATTDYWVNDEHGDPLMVVTARANAHLTRVLPDLLVEARAVVGDRRVTVVFDRGGWSPKLFARILADGFDILTYRKGKCRRAPARKFAEQVGHFDGREVRYQLADQAVVLLHGRLRLRQVTRLKDGHQTQILTSRRDLSAVEVAYRMFERWRQENFFKYLREEYALDALADYQLEPDDPTREVPNPAWAAADARLRQARVELGQLGQRYGVAAIKLVEMRPDASARQLRRVGAPIARTIWATLRRVCMLERRRARIPSRVPVARITDSEVIKLATERKHITNLIKMVAYQAESELTRAIAPHYQRSDDEGRTLVQTALASAADIEVTADELRVTLAPLSSVHRTRAVAALCRNLNAAAAVFPGTRLRLRYAVAGPTGPWA